MGKGAENTIRWRAGGEEAGGREKKVNERGGEEKNAAWKERRMGRSKGEGGKARAGREKGGRGRQAAGASGQNDTNRYVASMHVTIHGQVSRREWRGQGDLQERRWLALQQIDSLKLNPQ